MATRTILSPGVEIFERDLSLIAPQNVGTNVFITGYAHQGPTDEVIKITSRSELDQIYGPPTNSAERYFYHGIRELLNSPANIYTSRLPYGQGDGVGFGSEYSALVYPVKTYGGNEAPTVSAFDVSWNYATTLKGTPLSGASFTIQTSTGETKKVVYDIDGDGAFNSGDIVVPIQSSDSVASILTTTATTIQLSATDLTCSTGTKLLTIQLSGYVPLVANVPSTTASVLEGLDDEGDIFTVTSTLSTTFLDSALGNNLEIDSGVYILGSPVHFTLTEEQYTKISNGELGWGSVALDDRSQYNTFESISAAGMVILNKSKTSINSQFEGYYVGIADNTDINPALDYDSIIGAKTISASATYTPEYTTIPTGTFQFSLTSTPTGKSGSISQVVENLTDYDIDGRDSDDILSIAVFKIRKSLYATEAYKLDYILENGIVGSIDYHRTRPSQLGGSFVSSFLENESASDRNIEILINPNISNKNGSTSVDVNGNPTRKVRMMTTSLSSTDSSITGISDTSVYTELAQKLGYADNIYPVGTYSSGQLSTKILGDIPSKVNRALDAVKNDEIYDIDIVVEAGLGTIFTTTKSKSLSYYDETESFPEIDTLRTGSALTDVSVRDNYSTIFNIFESFCNLPSNTGGRGDCMFIADPIRHILVTGRNTKYLSDKSKNFQTHIYWAMRHQFEVENTSYAVVYANWAKIYDEFLGDQIWIPFSSVAAATYARNDAQEFPWSVPAGYTRGLLGGNVVDIAITPNQKQRDELYKSNLNPVLFSPSQGMAIFGQKTLSRKPSAFDRVNIRRGFFALERPTKKASMFFVFEPNTEFTRTRFVNTITPVFEYVKRNQGIYDYLIVCDERNNTSEVIDNGEMRADIYIKPVRSAEFILISFTATRSDANFEELAS